MKFAYPKLDLRSTKVHYILYGCLIALLLVGCESIGTITPTSTTTTGSTTTATSTKSATGINPQALLVGDSKISTSPKVGYVDACQGTFGYGGGAVQNGPWIHSDGTWDSTTKVVVKGNVTWPQANYSAVLSGNNRIITTKDLPVGFATGVFPIASTDPAYQYDRNPNHIAAQSLQYTLTAHPTIAQSPTCLGLGVIGVLKDGVVLYDALDGNGHDAVAHELQDKCAGHPDASNIYHHHDIPSCLINKATGQSTLVGYALDGFGIYVERDTNGHLLTNESLDACHGRTSIISWDGQEISMYHYVATQEYPYTLGCFKGTSVVSH